MRHFFFKTFLLLTLLASLVSPSWSKAAEKRPDTAKSLPDRIGTFRALGPASIPSGHRAGELQEGSIRNVARVYASENGAKFLVSLSTTSTDSGAYALLTSAARDQDIKLGVIGTATVTGAGAVFFCKGKSFVKIQQTSLEGTHDEGMITLAQDLAARLDSGINDIPVLIKHLPDWEKALPHARYAVSLQSLKDLLPNQPVLDAVSFAGGVEAALANYDSGKLLVIEFNTPQIATENDGRIAARLNELRSLNQQSLAVPSAYRRVGNYAVFVFDASSQDAANQLIEKVKYQQVVQWLGENPFLYEEATREFTETTLGVFVAVVKASGLALVTCFAVGGFLGGLLFIRRRTRQRAVEAYTDAGGMLRLNLDELTPQTDPAKLLGRGN